MHHTVKAVVLNQPFSRTPNSPFLGNDEKNLSDVKTFFQI
jgi:hypothetical protein